MTVQITPQITLPQAYQDRERHFLNRMDTLEKKLTDIQEKTFRPRDKCCKYFWHDLHLSINKLVCLILPNISQRYSIWYSRLPNLYPKITIQLFFSTFSNPLAYLIQNQSYAISSLKTFAPGLVIKTEEEVAVASPLKNRFILGRNIHA